MEISKIKAVIFDLGNVIVNLNVQATLDLFMAVNQSEEFSIPDHLDIKLHHDFEKGHISATEFCDGIRALLQTDASNDYIKDAWNAMLVDTPYKKLAFMEKAKERFNVYVLSNTNEIHVEAFQEQIRKNTNGRQLADFCDQIFFSHEMGLRKPDKEIYETMIKTIGLPPEEMLFLDDKKENIEAAINVGINGIQITHPDMVYNCL